MLRGYLIENRQCCQLFPCPLLARLGAESKFRQGTEEYLEEMIRKQRLSSPLCILQSHSFYPTPVHLLRVCWRHWSRQVLLTSWLSIFFPISGYLFKLCACVCVCNLPEYLGPDVSASQPNPDPAPLLIIVLSCGNHSQPLSAFLIKPSFPLPHGPEEGAPNFGFRNSPGVLYVYSFFWQEELIVGCNFL